MEIPALSGREQHVDQYFLRGAIGSRKRGSEGFESPFIQMASDVTHQCQIHVTVMNTEHA